MASLKYIKSFDGMRAVFCILIVWQHMHLKTLNVPFAVAWPSLQMFFVLSGYLICKILINEKNKGVSLKAYSKKFFTRRVFRIFPLYFFFIFLLIAIVLVFPNSQFVKLTSLDLEIKQNWWLLVTYMYNFKEMVNMAFDQPYMISVLPVHLWSLSLEEQFYMVIPFVIFFLSFKNLKSAFIAIIITVQILRAATFFYLTYKTNLPGDAIIFMLHRNILFQADSLAMGGLIATLNVSKIKHAKMGFYISLLVTVVITCIVAVTASKTHGVSVKKIINDHQFLANGYQIIYIYMIVNIMFAFKMICSIQGKPVWRWLYENPVSVYLGRMSYSMYVYQYFVIISIGLIIVNVFNKPNFKMQGSALKESVMLALVMGTLIAVSILSYKFVEEPFLKLKDKLTEKKAYTDKK